MSRLTFRSFFVFILVAFFSCKAQPATAEIELRSIRGTFGQYFMEGAWANRIALVLNQNNAARRVKIVLPAVDPAKGTVHYTAVASVPAKCQRRISIAFRGGDVQAKEDTDTSPNQNLESSLHEQSFSVWDTETQERLVKAIEKFVRLEPETTVIALVAGTSVEHDTYSYLNKLFQSPLGNVRTIPEQVSELPDRWYGYAMVRVLALGAIDCTELRESQVQAILDWVHRGGVLVLAGSPQMPDMLRHPLGHIAGVSAMGWHYIDRLKVTGPGLNTHTADLLWPLPMVELTSERAEVIYQANSLPLMTYRRVGQGHVFLLATPMGAIAAKPFHAIWHQVRKKQQKLPAINTAAFQKAARQTLQQVAGRPGPKRTVPLILLAALTAVVIVSGAVLRFRRRGELAWAILVPLAVLLSLGLYGYSLFASDPERLSHIGMTTFLEEDSVRTQEAFAYYSGPQSQELGFSTANPRGVISEIIGAGAATMQVSEVQTGSVLKLPNQQLPRGAIRAFYVDTVEATEKTALQMTFDREGLTGRLENRIGREIDDAVLLANRRSYRLGKLSADSVTSVRIREADRMGSEQFSGSVVPDPLRNELLRELIHRPGQMKEVSKAPVIIGYMSPSLLNPLGDKNLSHQGWSVVVWPIEITAPPAGTQVTLPAGFVDVEFPRANPRVWNSTSEKFLSPKENAELIVRAGPFPPLTDLTDTAMEIAVGIIATNYQLIVYGVQLNADEKIAERTEIARLDNPSGQLKIDVPQADRFRDLHGRITVSLAVKSLGQSVGPAEQRLPWQFQSIDVVLKGTVRD